MVGSRGTHLSDRHDWRRSVQDVRVHVLRVLIKFPTLHVDNLIGVGATVGRVEDHGLIRGVDELLDLFDLLFGYKVVPTSSVAQPKLDHSTQVGALGQGTV